jgi:phosphoribosylformylglycinamidine synthase PurS subunit
MKFTAEINIMPHKALLDPQGKAVSGGLKNLGLTNVTDVRVGKHISLEIEAATPDEAKDIAKTACEKLLVNPVMESYELVIKH